MAEDPKFFGLTPPAGPTIKHRDVIVSPCSLQRAASSHIKRQSVGSTASESSPPPRSNVLKTPRSTIILDSDEDDDEPVIVRDTYALFH